MRTSVSLFIRSPSASSCGQHSKNTCINPTIHPVWPSSAYLAEATRITRCRLLEFMLAALLEVPESWRSERMRSAESPFISKCDTGKLSYASSLWTRRAHRQVGISVGVGHKPLVSLLRFCMRKCVTEDYYFTFSVPGWPPLAQTLPNEKLPKIAVPSPPLLCWQASGLGPLSSALGWKGLRCTVAVASSLLSSSCQYPIDFKNKERRTAGWMCG